MEKKGFIFAPAKGDKLWQTIFERIENDSVYHKIHREQNHFETYQFALVVDNLKQTTTKSLILAQDER